VGILAVHFYPAGSIKNPIVLTENMYHKGSLNIVPNSQKLVNRLLVKGGQAVSASAYSQAITVGTVPIPLYYFPRSPVVVTIGGIVKTLGIQNIDAAGTYDFLLNAAEKLLIPDQCTAGTGTVDYYYEYPIKIILEEPSSQSQYGIFDDILMADTNDNDIALELGLKHLYKYSQPILAGSVKPFTGDFRAGQTIRVTVPRLAINHDLLIKEVTLSSTPGKPVEIALTLEEPERDIGSLLKKMQKRLAKLEAEVYSDNDGPLERYISKSDKCNWAELAIKTVHVCPLPSDTLYPADDLYPC
jgi:hypothetical protein